jgi:hypothetical protein
MEVGIRKWEIKKRKPIFGERVLEKKLTRSEIETSN